MDTKDWSVSAAIGTAISFAALIGIAVSEPLRVWYVLSVVLVLFSFSFAFVLIKSLEFLRNIKESLNDLRTRPYFPLRVKEIWQQKVAKETDYKLGRLELKLEYNDEEGKKVTYIKNQEIVAKRPGVNVIWDTGLRFDGDGIDWTSYRSSIGTAQVNLKKLVGAAHEVPTYLDTPLPVNKTTHRKVTFTASNAFLKKEENQSLRIIYPSDAACISVKLFGSKEFEEVKGFVTLGAYKEDNIPQPTLIEKNEAVWHISQPEIGERYVLLWTIKR